METLLVPVVTRGVEPQESSGIDRALIIDPKVYPGVPNDPNV